MNMVATEQQGVAGFCQRYHVKRLDLFGSATDPSSPRVQDVDFVVEFDNCTPSEHYERYFGLIESLEVLLGRPVDLVESSAIQNPYFRRRVNETRICIYGA